MRRPPRRLAALYLGAFFLVACTSGDDPAATPASGSTTPGTIVGLKAEQPAAWGPSGEDWAVTLTWSTSPGAGADRFEVRRDGVPIARDLSQPAYVDPDVDPGATYGYAVLGTAPDGAGTPPAGVRIRTNSPPLADARLEGSFLVDLAMAASTGVGRGTTPSRLLFRYAPRCGSGACSVRWTVRSQEPEGVLTRSGAGYRGRAHGPFMIRSCDGGPIHERIAVTTRIVGAGPVERAWRATEIEGTVVESGHAPGCSPARIRWRFAGVIQT